MSADWDADQGTLTPGHSLPFMEALKVSAEALIFRSAVPRWLLPLSQRGRRAIRGFMEMEVSNSSWSPLIRTTKIKFRNTCWRCSKNVRVPQYWTRRGT